MLLHDIDCDMDEDCSCGAEERACRYCAGSGEACDPLLLEGWAGIEPPKRLLSSMTCPECGGTGLRSQAEA